MTEPMPDRRIGDFLDMLAARTPAPSAGAGAAVTVGAAAALVAMAARFSDGPLGELAARADRLRADVLPLSDADGEAYGLVLAAFRVPRQQPDRKERIGAAMQAATDVPLQIAQAGAEVAAMAAQLALGGNRNVSGDAQAAALLAEGAVRAAVRIVQLNSEIGELDDAWTDQADRCLRTAHDAAIKATGGTS